MQQHPGIQYLIAHDHVDALRREARRARLTAQLRRKSRSGRRSR